jgi:hypothetical protein
VLGAFDERALGPVTPDPILCEDVEQNVAVHEHVAQRSVLASGERHDLVRGELGVGAPAHMSDESPPAAAASMHFSEQYGIVPDLELDLGIGEGAQPLPDVRTSRGYPNWRPSWS